MKRQPNNNGGFSLLEVILAMAILAIISHSAAVLFYAVHEVQCDDGGQTACNQSGAGSAGGFKKPKRTGTDQGCGDRLSCSLSGRKGLIPCSVRLRRLPRHRHFRRRMCTTHRQAFPAGRMMSRFPSVRLQLKMTPISHRSKGSMTQKMLWHWNITSCRKQ